MKEDEHSRCLSNLENCYIRDINLEYKKSPLFYSERCLEKQIEY